MAGSVSGVTDEDWFSIDASAAGKLTAKFDVEGLESPGWDIRIQNSAGDVLGSFNCSWYDCRDNGISLDVGVGSAGTYYVVVTSASSYSSFDGNGAYKLNVTTSTTTAGIENEPNETLYAAQKVSSGVDTTGSVSGVTDEDWYAIDASAAGTLTAKFDVEGLESPGWDIRIRNSAGNILGSFNCSWYDCRDNGISLDVGIGSSGTYYVQVTSASSYSSFDGNGAYKLNVTTNTTTAGIENEPNETLSAAQKVGSGEDMAGSVSGVTDEDWYAIDASAAGTLTAKFDVEGLESPGWDIRIQNSAGNILGSFNCSWYDCRDNGISLDVGIGSAGTYYVKVTSASSYSSFDGNGAYKLNVTTSGDLASVNSIIGDQRDETFDATAGNDSFVGNGGDDIFNISEKGLSDVDTIDGGAGSDTLAITYEGVRNLEDLVLGVDGDFLTTTDATGGVVKFKDIDILKVGLTTNSRRQMTYIENDIDNTFWSADEYKLHMYGGGNVSAESLVGLDGFVASTNLAVRGSSSADSINLNINRLSSGDNDYLTGAWRIKLGAGNDSISSGKFKFGDSVDLGSGNDTVQMMITGDYGTPTIASANTSGMNIDGGPGNDTIIWGGSVLADEVSLSTTTGRLKNFENIEGSGFNDVISGDENANVLTGTGGADVISGLAGDDILFAYNSYHGWPSDSSKYLDADGNCSADKGRVTGGTENDNLSGGPGNDRLCGSNGDNRLSPGTGTDTITSGDGKDTVHLRVGDGSMTLAGANILTDFSDGNDSIAVLAATAAASPGLSIEQGVDNYSNDVIIAAGGEYLLVIQNTLVSAVTRGVDIVD